ncbi:MAG: copper chaperone PCu(A)C, partial [Pseudomonadota bacterium]
GSLVLMNGFAFATLPNQPVGAGFISVQNNGSDQDRLVAVTSPAAGKVEIHTMEMDGDVMRMREVAGGLIIPAGEAVEMAPGGIHLMFMQISDGLVLGDTVPVTLSFEHADDVTVMLQIQKRTRSGQSHSNHGAH